MWIAIGIAVTLALLVLIVLYPWLALGVVMFTTQFKLAAMYYIPFFRKFDFTVFTLLLAGLAALSVYIRRIRTTGRLHLPKTQLICMCIIAVGLWIGMLWTTAPEYGFEKARGFTGICIPILLLPAFFIRTKKDGLIVIKMAIIVGIISAVVLVAFPDSPVSELKNPGAARATGVGGDPTMMAELCTVCIVCLAVALIIKGGLSKVMRYSAIVVFPLALYALLATGSRAAMLGLLFSILILPLFMKKGRKFKAAVVGLLVVPLVLYAVFQFLPGTETSGLTSRWLRFSRWELGGGGAFGTRQRHFMFVLSNWWTRPVLGHGSGSFAMDCFGVDIPMWPHNIVLEALYETGLVGMAAMLVLLIIPIREGLRGLKEAISPQDRFLVAAPLMAILLLMVPALMHFGLHGLRLLYLFVGILHANVVQLSLANREEFLLYAEEGFSEASGPASRRVPDSYQAQRT